MGKTLITSKDIHPEKKGHYMEVRNDLTGVRVKETKRTEAEAKEFAEKVVRDNGRKYTPSIKGK